MPILMPMQSPMRVVGRDVCFQTRRRFQPVFNIMTRSVVALLVEMIGVFTNRVLARFLGRSEFMS